MNANRLPVVSSRLTWRWLPALACLLSSAAAGPLTAQRPQLVLNADNLLLTTGQTATMHLIATMPDGTVADVTNDPGTSFLATDPTILSLGAPARMRPIIEKDGLRILDAT